jgi:lipoprotein signal peptidase
VLYGAVVDFVHVWVNIGGRTWSWPDFNVADASITVGAVLLIANEFRTPRAEADDAPDSD